MIVHIFIKGVDLMEEKYSLNKLNYRIYGEGKDALLLHGWWQGTYQMLPIAHILQGYRCLVVDLPGFGESCVPENVLTIKDYALIINRLCQKLKFKPSLVIGHSFGGKVAYAYALSHKVEHLVLAHDTERWSKIMLVPFDTPAASLPESPTTPIRKRT